jgi:hypothetical protein
MPADFIAAITEAMASLLASSAARAVLASDDDAGRRRRIGGAGDRRKRDCGGERQGQKMSGHKKTPRSAIQSRLSTTASAQESESISGSTMRRFKSVRAYFARLSGRMSL